MQTNLRNEDSPRYTGWKVVAAAFLGVMVGFAGMVPFTFSLFLVPLHSTFGWKREAISRAFGIAALTVALVSPLIGSLLDRLPPRRVILPCIAIFSAAMASFSLLHGTLLQYYGTYFVLGIVGNGTAQLAYSRAVLSWFRQRRGLAIGLMLTGSGAGSIILPMLAQHVITAHGWRAAYAVLGATALAGLPLTALFMLNRPASQMQQPGRAEFPHATRTGSHRTFWLIALPTLLVALSMNALIAHLSALLTSRGISAASAAVTLSIYGASAIAGRLLTGFLLDRISAPNVSCAVLVIASLGVFVEAYANTPAAGWAGALLMGAGSGSEADVVPYMIAMYFDRRRSSTLYGLTWTAYAIGGAIGPVLLGHAYDRSGTYATSAIVALGVPCALAAAMQLLLPRAVALRGAFEPEVLANTVEPAI